MFNFNFEEATSLLIREFEGCPYVKDSMLGNAATDRKLRCYITAAIKENYSRSECKDKLHNLLSEQEVCEDGIVEALRLVEVYYTAKELIDNGYMGDYIRVEDRGMG